MDFAFLHGEMVFCGNGTWGAFRQCSMKLLGPTVKFAGRRHPQLLTVVRHWWPRANAIKSVHHQVMLVHSFDYCTIVPTLQVEKTCPSFTLCVP